MQKGYWLIVAVAILALTCASSLAPAQTPTSAPGGITSGAPQDGQTADAAGEKDGSPAGTQPAPSKPGGGLFEGPIIWVLLGGMVLMLLLSGRGRKKEQKKRKVMLESLKKGDKVVSIGGIVGTVIEVRADEVMVKVDETNNIRVKLARWAIRGVGDSYKSEDPAAAAKGQSSEKK
jgi:preprotein translocase subunit YajC